MISLTKKALKTRLFKELTKFGIIGISAAIVNFVAVILLVHAGLLSPLVANIIAFLIAFQVSFFGHKLWTFRHAGKHVSTMSKFFIVAIAGFFLTESLFAFFLKAEHLYYPLALVLTLVIVPPITFTFSKAWAFRK